MLETGHSMFVSSNDSTLPSKADPGSADTLVIDETNMRMALKGEIRGQDHIIDHLSTFIRLQWGEELRKKTIANILFVGPSATGKTMCAAALGRYLFDGERNMLQFDCSEFIGVEGKNRLIGVPTGYLGSERGGRLTRPVFLNPRRLIVFDQIEKAHSSIFDVLLPLMRDGQVTEQGSGKVADFTQCVVALTTNAQHEAIGALQDAFENQFELDQAVRSVLRDSKTLPPEIISRLDQVYVFKPIEGIVNAEIAAIKIRILAREYGVELEYIEPELVVQIMEKADQAGDTRELTRLVEVMFGDILIRARSEGIESVRIELDAAGMPVVRKAKDANQYQSQIQRVQRRGPSFLQPGVAIRLRSIVNPCTTDTRESDDRQNDEC